MSEIAERLRALPAFPDHLPVLDLDTVPEHPDALFAQWLDEAIASGARQPHAMSFVTLGPDGAPLARTLILKDIDDCGYHVSTRNTSRKAAQISADPRATMLFFWRESGRQVQITGTVTALGADVSQADWENRSTYDGTPNPEWQVYALRPDGFEFLQARHDRQHTRVGYRRRNDQWTHFPVTTPAG